MTSSRESIQSNDDKGTAYFWKSTSIEPQISSLSLRHGIAKVALGSEHTIILTYDSQIFATGENAYGQLGFGDQTRRVQTTRLTYFDGKDVIDISCGANHSSAVCDDGALYCWGDSRNGQCGIGEAKSVHSPTLVEFDPDLRPTTRPRSRPVDSDDGKLTHCSSPERPKSTHLKVKIVQVSCGESHTLALTSTGEVWSWGTGCQVGHGKNIETVKIPQLVEGLFGKNVISIESGAYHSMALVKDSSTIPKIIPQRTSKLTRGSKKKQSKKIRRFSRSTETTKGKKAPSLFQSNEAIPNTETRQSSTTKTYLSYDAENSLQNNVEEEENAKSLKEDVFGSQGSDNSINSMNKVQTGRGIFTDSQNITKADVSPERKDDVQTLLPSSSSDDKLVLETNVSQTENMSSCNNESPSTNSDIIPINQLNIQDNHYEFPGHTLKVQTENLISSSPEYSCSPPQSGFSHSHFDNKPIQTSIVTTNVSGCLHRSNSLFESVEQISQSSLGSVSDSDEVASPVTEEQPDPVSSYLSIGILTSRLRQEMDISKLTNAVYDSVTGIFMSPSTLPAQADKSAVHTAHCSECGVLGICVCNGKSPNSHDRFIHEGYDTQVWTWGSGGCGQLGQGDTEDRSVPCCVEELSGTGIIKISAGTFHSLALTIYCQVFSWGDNSCGQLGHKKSIAVRPRKVKCFSDVLVWDIACGSHYSMFIGDMALNRPDVYVCGRQPSDMPAIAAALKQLHESASPVSDDSAIQTSIKTIRPLTKSRSFDDTKERSLGVRIELVRLIMFRKVGSVRSVHAKNEHCCCLSSSDSTRRLDELSELSSQERFFYYQLALIWQAVLVPVLQSDLWTIMFSQDSGSVLLPVIQAYLSLMKCVSSSVVSVTEIIQKSKSLEQLFDTCLSDDFIKAFERYSELVSNAVAIGVFMLFASLAHEVGPQCKAVLRDLLEDADKEFISYIDAFQCVARVPMVRIQHYADVSKKLLSILSKNNPIYWKVQRASDLWDKLSIQDEKRYLLAEQTRLFWEDCPTKISETFKIPNRRLLRSSKTHPLYPSKSGRFSSPTYVLFDDYFVTIQSSKNYQAFPLNTLWAEKVDNTDNLLHAIKITSPEETLLVCASCDDDRTDWLLTINNAIVRVISNTTAYRLGKDAVNAKTGNLSAATAREAVYTFTQDLRYKNATYNGMWLTGKPHGRGEMSWSDGRHYSGEFQNGLHDGEGVMVFPSNPDNPAEKYEGHWLDGKMAGPGKMKYTNGDTYVGHWLDNMRHGHGTMKCGALSSSAASVYIGEWMANKRHGYGSLDDVLKGEKYMGMWENDCRHGNGVVVTLEGLYIQGIFLQNKMMGPAQLVTDDNTTFDGEFSSQFLLAGKGTLTLPTGDYIDGTFNGPWGDGIKISGTFYKKHADSNSKTKCASPDVKPVMSPDKKWVALFNQCRVSLGCHGDQDSEITTAWKCVSMALLSGHNGKLPRTEQDVMQELLNVNNEMERTGNHHLHDYNAIQSYLTKAFEMSYHPLGQLVSGLVDVYRATYVGMGTHRRLLPHAVAEAKSIIHRLYNVVRLLFSDLPNEEYVLLDTDSLTGISNHHTELSTSSSALLHPIVLPLLYPPLFTLYALHNERADSLYWERLMHLNWRSDLSLMKFVGVKRQFWLSENEEEDIRTESESQEANHYVSAIEALQQISTKLSPMEKLAVLKTTFEKINEEVHQYWKGEEKLISLDDLFPVFQFVTIRARIPHMGSEIHFIDDMVDSHVHVGEQGHMFTTLKASFFQIQNEKG